MYVGVKLRLHTHRECGLRILSLYHTSYVRGYWSAPFSEDVFTGYYVR